MKLLRIIISVYFCCFSIMPFKSLMFAAERLEAICFFVILVAESPAYMVL